MTQHTRTLPTCQLPTLGKNESLALIALQVDEKSSAAMALFKAPGSFAQEIALAQSIAGIRELLTAEVMAPIMALMNTPLGFKTDRDPKVTPGATPYGYEVVRECFMESKLRGYHAAGNEWNIISGQFYAAKNGLRRQVTGGKYFSDVSDFKDFYEVPRLVGDKGAIVKCKATWKRGGVEDSLEIEIPVKVNSYMGADAILGKAERKLLKRVHDRLSGMSTPDGEVDEIDVTPKSQTMSIDFGKPAAPAPTVAAAPVITTVQEYLRGIIETAGFTLEDLVKWGLKDGWFKDPAEARQWTQFQDIPTVLANKLSNAKDGLLGGIRAMKGGAR